MLKSQRRAPIRNLFHKVVHIHFCNVSMRASGRRVPTRAERTVGLGGFGTAYCQARALSGLYSNGLFDSDGLQQKVPLLATGLSRHMPGRQESQRACGVSQRIRLGSAIRDGLARRDPYSSAATVSPRTSSMDVMPDSILFMPDSRRVCMPIFMHDFMISPVEASERISSRNSSLRVIIS